jgi:hypothetical protein
VEEAPGLDRLGQFVNRREVRALRRALRPGERVLHVLEATRGRKGLLAATDRRILFATAGFLRRKAASWPYPQVAGLKVVRAIDDAELQIEVRMAAEPVSFAGCRKRDAEAFVATVRKRPPGPDDPLDFTPAELKPKTPEQKRREQLGRMLRKGSITKAEYDRRLATLDDE